ncbi:MAG: VOC family protein [Calditrichaeota bacterium]|nr:MAG: VOC family protein [Calditrichota bacterium]
METPKHGSFCWNELITSDTKKAGEFYSKLLGWTETPFEGGMPYTLFTTGKKSEGGMMAITPEMGDSPSQWMSYITVDDVDASAKQAEELGGKIICPPTDIPTVGRIVLISDPTGATVGLITFPTE